MEFPSLYQTRSPGTLASVGVKEINSFLWGSSEVFALSHLWQVDGVLGGEGVFVLDCAIRFNPLFLSDQAMERGVSPEEVLSRVMVQRAFTPYQILDAVSSLFRRLEKGESFIPFILAPAKQFLDGDVAADEGSFLLGHLAALIGRFRTHSLPLVVVEKGRYQHRLFPPFFEKLQKEISFQLSVHDGSAAVCSAG